MKLKKESIMGRNRVGTTGKLQNKNENVIK